MKKDSLNSVPLIFVLTCAIILLSVELSANHQTSPFLKKEPISPQQLIENLEKESFRGEKISLRLYNQEVVKILKEISRISGLPMKIDPDISGRITLVQLNTPWDQILSRLLKKADLQITFDDVHLQVKTNWGTLKKKKKKYLQKISDKTPKKYTGELGDFIFKDADLTNVILFFAENYKLNIVLDPGINGKVTCRLTQVPWDQALEVILRRHGLAIIQAGSIVKIKKY